MTTMKAVVFAGTGRLSLEDVPKPRPRAGEALVRVTTTTICGTDIHILKGEYPVRKGLTVGHEPVGIIEKLGSAVQGYREGQRVIAGAICTSGHSHAAHFDFSGIGLPQPDHTLERGRLSRSIRTEQAEDFAVFDVEADALRGLHLVVALVQVANANLGHTSFAEYITARFSAVSRFEGY